MKLLPKQHGASVMFVAALIIGASTARAWTWASLAMLFGLSSAFLLREPLVHWIKEKQHKSDNIPVKLSIWIAFWGFTALAAAIYSVRVLALKDLMLLALMALFPFVVSIAAPLGRFTWRWWVDGLGGFGAALAMPMMYLAGRGQMDMHGWRLFTVVAIFFVGATLHLHAMIRRGRAMQMPDKNSLRRACLFSVAVLVITFLLVLVGWLPALLALATLPAALRPIIMRGRVISKLSRVGLAETALASIFALLLISLAA